MIESLHKIDSALFLWLNSLHLNWLDQAMVFLSSQILWYPFTLFFLYFAYKQFGKKTALYFALFLLMAIVASDVTSSQIFKNLFGRLRPCRAEDIKELVYRFGQKCGGRFGFVSSHASNSFALMSFSLITLGLQRPVRIMATALAVLVSFSRIYLGVHYPADILGGAAVGIGWGIFFAWSFKQVQGATR